jgi:hypothetical protein
VSLSYLLFLVRLFVFYVIALKFTPFPLTATVQSVIEYELVVWGFGHAQAARSRSTATRAACALVEQMTISMLLTMERVRMALSGTAWTAALVALVSTTSNQAASAANALQSRLDTMRP